MGCVFTLSSIGDFGLCLVANGTVGKVIINNNNNNNNNKEREPVQRIKNSVCITGRRPPGVIKSKMSLHRQGLVHQVHQTCSSTAF